MTEHAPPTETPGSDGPTRAELSLATEIALAMVKTAKGLRTYLPNSPNLQKFFHELQQRMQKYHTEFGEFQLEIGQFSFRYRGGYPLCESRDDRDSMAFRMYGDGIRSVVIAEGVEALQLHSLLSTVMQIRTEDADDDIVTRLWEMTLPHVTLILAEDFGYPETDDGPPPFGDQQEQIRRLYDSLPAMVAPRLPAIPPEVLTLTAEESELLHALQNSDIIREPVREITRLLAAILSGVTDAPLVSPFLHITVKLAADLTTAGNIRSATEVLGMLRRLAGSDAVTAGMAARALAGFLNESTIPSLCRIIDTPEGITRDDLRELLRHLGEAAVPGICEVLGRVEKMGMRRVILETLVEFGRHEPLIFSPLLDDPRWYLVRNVLLILTKLGNPDMLEPVSRLISHPDERVRKEVLHYLEQVPGTEAKSSVIRFLRDSSQGLRIRALQILGKSRFAPAFPAVSAMTERKEFDGAALEEKKAIYESLGLLGQEQMLPLFRSMLLKRHWFNRTRRQENIFCAVAGLRRIGGRNARMLLEEELQRSDGGNRDLILEAIAGITVELDAAAAETARAPDGLKQ